MKRWWLLLVLCAACSKKSSDPAAGSGAATGGAGLDGGAAAAAVAVIDGPAPVAPAIDAGPPSATANKRELQLAADEKLHEPPVSMPWTPWAGRRKVTLVDVAGPPPSSRLVVWGEGQRADVLSFPATCLGGEHGAETWTGAKNTVVFRCESQAKDGIVADEWLIVWPKENPAPTVAQHWQGAQKQRDPDWAGGRELYAPEKPEPDEPECCCAWQDETESYERTTRRYCKGSDDHHGICVADSKCVDTDD